ncbi:uncharacterized protein LOC125763489 isoform X2 [Anopheles funestus]|uniref:odorant receptor 4-like n=1 Tax=Anopheles funestus TaxID=62324 RepID=UPI0020C72469|nr:odorant receptor 4-like [Anopheles funestus]
MVIFEPFNNPLEILPLPLKLFAKLGVTQYSVDRVRLLIFNSYLLLTFFIPKFCLGYDTIPQFFRGVAEGMCGVNTCITLFCLSFKMDQMEMLLRDLKLWTDIVSITDEYKQILITLNTGIHKYTKYYFIFTNCILVAMMASSTAGVLYIYTSQTPGQTVSFPLIMEHRLYTLNAHHDLLHWFLYHMLLIPAILIMVIIYTAKAGMFFGSICFCSTLFSILALKIDRLRFLITTEQYTAELKEIIVLHQLAIRCAKLLQKILMDVMLAQFTGCVLIWCFFFYSIMISGITVEGVTVAAILLSFSMETFIFCLLGNELTIKVGLNFNKMMVDCSANSNILLPKQGEQISAAVYATDWYEQPIKIQKLIIPIIQQAQQRIGITAARFYYIDVKRYGKNLKTAYSFYLLLRDIF